MRGLPGSSGTDFDRLEDRYTPLELDTDFNKARQERGEEELAGIYDRMVGENLSVQEIEKRLAEMEEDTNKQAERAHCNLFYRRGKGEAKCGSGTAL